MSTAATPKRRGRPPVVAVNVQPGLRIVKKYGNRRLYDTQGSRYVNLEELVVTPQGKKVLIDAGTPQSGDELIAALTRHGVQSLDLVVASHPHADHIGGMKKVLDRFPVKNFLDSGQPHTSATYERMLKAINEAEFNQADLASGQTEIDAKREGFAELIYEARVDLKDDDEETRRARTLPAEWGVTQFGR